MVHAPRRRSFGLDSEIRRRPIRPVDLIRVDFECAYSMIRTLGFVAAT